MPRNNGFSDEDLALLSDEEREGMLDEDVVDEGADEDVADDAADDEAAAKIVEEAAAAKAAEDAEAKKIADAAKEGDDDADPAKVAADAAAAEADAKAKADAAVAEAAKPAAADSKPTPPAFPKYEAPADAQKTLATIEAQRDELAKKFDEGELTAAEFRAQSRPLEQQKDDLREQILKASLSHDAQIQNWTKVAVPTFLSAHTQYAKGTILHSMLDLEVKKLQANTDNPLDPDILVKAHEKIQAELGIVKRADPTVEKKPVSEPKKRVLPPSINSLPADDITEDGGDGGEFAFLDRLSPEALERAMEKMSDEQRERYLAAG